MKDYPSKTAWEAANVIKCCVKINKNQDPELFEMFAANPNSNSSLTRELLREALEARKAKDK